MKAIFTVLAALLPALCGADEIKLANGSVIQGKLGNLTPATIQIITQKGAVALHLDQLSPESRLAIDPAQKRIAELMADNKKLQETCARLGAELRGSALPATKYETSSAPGSGSMPLKDGQIITIPIPPKSKLEIRRQKTTRRGNVKTIMEMAMDWPSIRFETTEGTARPLAATKRVDSRTARYFSSCSLKF